MLKRTFTVEECQHLLVLLSKFWTTKFQISNDELVNLGVNISTWVVETSQKLQNITEPIEIEISEQNLQMLFQCLHYQNCSWAISETGLYTQFIKFCKQFVKLEQVTENEDSITSPVKTKKVKK